MSVVEIERVDTIGLIALNNPPVNAASTALRQGIQAALHELDADNAINVIAIYGKGRTFIAGADITEFGKPLKEPFLPDLCTEIERTQTPVISVLHGTTLGGGLEVALGTHARIAIKGSKVGLPEVALGLLPGAGGTQRTPRLVGIPAALEMITSGRHVGADEAGKLGLVDRVVEGDPREIAIESAKDVLSGKLPTRRTGELTVEPNDAALADWRKKITAKSPFLFSPQKCIDAVALSTKPIDEGIPAERALFMECMKNPQSAGLQHAFFAERAVQKIPEAKAEPRAIESVGIIGGGTMGSGIGTSMLMAGLPLTLIERDDAAIERTRATITGNLDGAVKRGKMLEATRDDILANKLTLKSELEALSEVDLIVEAVFEEMDVKKDIFTKLDKIAKSGAILATNTSYLDVDEIAACTSRPEDVIGLHFFSPAHIMRLLEVVVAEKTAPEVVASGFALGKRMKKVAVRAGVCDGFIGNRILTNYKKSVDYMMLDGAAPHEIDAAIEGFGFAMGPFAVYDLAGLDIGWAARKRQLKNKPAAERDVGIADRICERGWFGRKTGQGFYVYEGRDRTPNPAVADIIDSERQKAGITLQKFSDEDIVDRAMTAIILEAIKIVEEGIALRPIDVDAVYLFGYGFPRFRGGPLHLADQIGAKTLLARTEAYAKEDAHFWQIPALLITMAENGDTFSAMNR
ncbi:MAG: 3-hydroxyacyl-CoA dehydrogenase NAD-binding domain-containing protein [Hyphomicrobiales bacterium]